MKKFVSVLLLSFAYLIHAANIIYPADGNINMEEGTLEMILAVDFDAAKPPQNTSEFPGSIFSMDFPGDSSKNHFIMRCWKQKLNDGTFFSQIRISQWYKGKGKGGPCISIKNWKQGELHHISMSWQRGMVKMYCDGKEVWKGSFALPSDLDLRQVYLMAGGRAVGWETRNKWKREDFLPQENSLVTIAAIRISANCRIPDNKLVFSRDKMTLLLDDFRGQTLEGKKTSPVCISNRGKQYGSVHGVIIPVRNGISLHRVKK